MNRTLYELIRLNCDGLEVCCATTSAKLMAAIARRCQQLQKPDTLYEVRPALPAHLALEEGTK